MKKPEIRGKKAFFFTDFSVKESESIKELSFLILNSLLPVKFCGDLN